jgi:glycine/D-amino acid oxidase-like deaminating enzyme
MKQPTSSFWLNDSPYHVVRSTPELPSRSQVVVIGGGITGVSTAYWLRKQGIDVTLLEQRGISEGATGRNGGHIAAAPIEQFIAALKTYGRDTAYAMWEYSKRTTQAIKDFVAEHNVRCDLQFSGGAELALSQEERIHIQKIAETLAKYGFEFDYWDADTCAEKMHSPDFVGGFFLDVRGQLWAAKLVFAIAEQALQLGANFQTQTPVTMIERTRSHLIVRSDRGDIYADHVVHATNAWANQLLPFLKDIIRPIRGQVLVTEPVERLWDFGFSTNYDYEYCIQRPDLRIVLGGMRWKSPTYEENINDDTQVESHVSKGLREFLPKHFSALKQVQIEQEWTGIMGFSPDHNPLIGELPDRPNEWIAAGFTGHGMSRTFYAGKAIAELIAGHDPEVFVDAFLPDRFLSREKLAS